MAVSPKKTTHSRQGKRRSHHFIKNINYLICKNCSSFRRNHYVCQGCGEYKGKIVIQKEGI